MTSLFVKPMADLTAADVEAFLREAPPENLFLELKQDLPEKNGGASLWMRGEARFEDKSRNDLANEIVAFANGDGGTLLLGVVETESEPKRPTSLNPLPNPATLARRLHDAIVGIVEPPLSGFEASGVVVRDDGSGIVVFRIEPSQLAPHRLMTGDYQSYVRRDDKKRKMAMREIHDMVLQREFARSRFERIFLEAEQQFRESELLANPPCPHLRWQIMVAPRRPVRVMPSDNVLVPDADLVFEFDDREPLQLRAPFQRSRERSAPILGGLANIGDIRFQEPGKYGWRIKEERYRDGRYLVSLEITVHDSPFGDQREVHEPFVGADWLVLWLLRALNWIVLVRRAAGEPGLDFGLQFMTDNRHAFVLRGLRESQSFYDPHQEAKHARLVASPIYEMGTGQAMLFAANEAFTDLFNSFGEDPRGARILNTSYDLNPEGS